MSLLGEIKPGEARKQQEVQPLSARTVGGQQARESFPKPQVS